MKGRKITSENSLTIFEENSNSDQETTSEYKGKGDRGHFEPSGPLDLYRKESSTYKLEKFTTLGQGQSRQGTLEAGRRGGG